MAEIFFSYLKTRPEYADPETCRRELVGPMRSDLSRQGDLSLLRQFPDMPPKAAVLLKSKAVANDKLSDFCARCRRCPWGQEIMPLSPQH